MLESTQVGLVAAAEAYLRQELKTGRLRRQLFPMLTGFGISDYQDTVRTMGLNYLTEIGRRVMNLTAISEYPIFPQGKYNARDYREVSLGSVWLERSTNQPFLLAEFERFDEAPGQMALLRERVENLIIGYHQLGGHPAMVLLVFWTYLGTNTNRVKLLLKFLEQGFSLSNHSLVPGLSEPTRLLIYHCLATGNSKNLILNQWIALT